MQDPYYNRDEVSNSDLGELEKYFYGAGEQPEPVEAYRFGTLIDCMVTEPYKINYFNHTCDNKKYTKEEFEQAYEMLKAVRRDRFTGPLLQYFDGQKIFSKKGFQITYGNIQFSLSVRCKWDLWSDTIKWGGDIKSTAATSQKQFEEACRYFKYPRQRAWYMDISGAKQDILIGISKKTFEVYKIPITRGSGFYKDGKEMYSDLAFKWYTMFEDFNN